MRTRICREANNIFKQQGDLLSSDCFTLEDGADILSRNIGNHQSTLRNIPEERRSHLQHGGSLKSRNQTTKSLHERVERKKDKSDRVP
jgi:hypothetical protein